MGTTATVKQLLTPLRNSITNKPPYTSGTLQLPASSFSLFYKITKDDRAARHIDLAHASFDDLEQLALACDPTAFGVDDDHDEASVKSGKMDVERFVPILAPDHTVLEKLIKDYHFEGPQGWKKLTIELLELNVYGKGSFSDPHLYPPHRVGQRVGFLIIIFPTPHEGGTLVLTHENNEWSFDYGAELVAGRDPSIGYVAFFGDVSHGVTPVKSGHCVTLTYELYLGYLELVPEPPLGDLIYRAHERAFCENLEVLLENPEFLPDGGTLGFGMRHMYPITEKRDVEHVRDLLKGSDFVVFRCARALGFEPMVYALYEWQPPGMESIEGGLAEHVIEFGYGEPIDVTKLICRQGGIVVCQDPDSYLKEDGAHDRPEKIEWVTPKPTFNRQGGTCINIKGELIFVYGDFCLVVRVGKAGERLAYPTSAQLKRVWMKDLDMRPSAFWNRTYGLFS